MEQDVNSNNLVKLKSREEELDLFFENLYEDKILGHLTEERYKKLANKYEQGQFELTDKLKKAEELVNTDNQKELDVNRFLKMVRKYTHIEELSRERLHHFISKIVVYHREEVNMSTTQRVEFHFNFIGKIELPDPDERKRNLKSFDRNKKENQTA